MTYHPQTATTTTEHQVATAQDEAVTTTTQHHVGHCGPTCPTHPPDLRDYVNDYKNSRAAYVAFHYHQPPRRQVTPIPNPQGDGADEHQHDDHHQDEGATPPSDPPDEHKDDQPPNDDDQHKDDDQHNDDDDHNDADDATSGNT